MKKFIVFFTILLLLVNAIIGLIVSAYQPTNVIINSIVLLLNGVVLWALYTINIKDAFRISLTWLFSVIGIAEYLLGFVAPNELENNWFAILVIVLLVFEIAVIYIVNLVTTKNN